MSSDVSTAERVANVGKHLILKDGAEVIVKEISMEGLLSCAAQLTSILDTFDRSKSEKGSEFLKNLFSNEEAYNALRNFAAMSTNTLGEFWKDRPLKDWTNFIVIAKDLNDWEELKKLFTDLGIMKWFLSLQKEP